MNSGNQSFCLTTVISHQLRHLDGLTEALDVISELPLLLRAVDAGQVHAMEPAVLLRLEPVGLQSNIVSVSH